MTSNAETSSRAVQTEWFRRMLPSSEVVDELLGDDSGDALLMTVRQRAPVELGIKAEAVLTPAVAALAQTAKAAIEKLRDSQFAELTDAEIAALHAFVHVALRPAVRVANGVATAPAVPWQRVNDNEPMISPLLRGVGRLDTHASTPTGTGWLVAPGLLMTNNHVVAQLAGVRVPGNPGWRRDLDLVVAATNKLWNERPALRPIWDPRDTPDPQHVSVARVMKIRATHPTCDMALLEVDGVDTSRAPVLALSQAGPKRTSQYEIYVAGYPAVLPNLPLHPALVDLLFGGPDPAVSKRVSPGQLIGLEDATLNHDASTLGGSSGSAVVDFENHRVIALHFAGIYGRKNQCVPLWTLATDPFFVKNNLTFA